MTRHLFFDQPAATRHLDSSPTRRSSDLQNRAEESAHTDQQAIKTTQKRRIEFIGHGLKRLGRYFVIFWAHNARSEEHTSELQSRGHLVCRLLLEKKKEFFSRFLKR